MDKIRIKHNSEGDTRTADHIPDREEFDKANWSHKNDVSNLMNAFALELKERAERHDWTKVEEPYATMFYNDLKATLEKKMAFEDGKWANLHYNELERHHVMRHCPDDVTLFDIVEMICDCVAAGMARSGYLLPFNLGDDTLEKAFANTVDYMLDHVEVY